MKKGTASHGRIFRIAYGLILLFSAFIQAHGQTVDYDHAIPASWLRGAELRLGNPNIEGTPYLFKDWMPGTMLMTNGRVVEDIRINFVNQEGEVMVTKPYAGLDVQYGVIELDVVSVTIKDEDQDRRFVRYWADTIESTGDELHYFYEVLAEGKVSLLKKPYKFFKRAKLREAYSNGNNKAKFVLKREFFLRLPGQESYTTMRLSKGLVLRAIGKSRADEAKRLMKAQKGKWNRGRDVGAMLVQLFR